MSEQACITKSFMACPVTGKKYESGTRYQYNIFVAKPEENTPDLALYVLLEMAYDVMTPMLNTLMDEGLIPYGMVLTVTPGTLPATLPDGADRYMRAVELDQYGPEFSDFLVEELIPDACRTAGERLSEKADMHFICGGSSGGMAAWNAVWFRNDYFRRAYLSSPTFSAMRGGEEAMVIARKTETKPIKLYITVGTEEPDHFFGSSLLAAQNAAYALEFAGYDLRFEQFNGEGHCSRFSDVTLWRRMMLFLWANWKTVPVLPLGDQVRIRKLLAEGSRWQKYDGAFPEKQPVTVCGGVYSFAGDKIFFEKDGIRTVAADGFGTITALGLSSDKWRLYVADEARRFVYALSVMPDGSLKDCKPLAPIHLKYDFRRPGAADLAVLADDRVLVATELGVQGIVSFGLTDLILPLPGDLPAERVAVCGKTLYAASGDVIFTRELKIGGGDCLAPAAAPATAGYNDGYSYVRSHMPCP